jgi:30S ribosomal protein S31
MGRGDRKTKKGKISIRSYGNARPHTAVKTPVGAKKAPAAAKTAVAKKPAAPVKKAPAKKSV